MAKSLFKIAGFILLLAVARNIDAHHSFGAEFDGNKTVTLKGVITKVEWANPHCHFYMDVKDPAGKTTNWKFEGFPPNVLARTGFKKDVTLKVGDSLTVFGWRARDGSALAHAREDAGGRKTALLWAARRNGRRKPRPQIGEMSS